MFTVCHTEEAELLPTTTAPTLPRLRYHLNLVFNILFPVLSYVAVGFLVNSFAACRLDCVFYGTISSHLVESRHPKQGREQVLRDPFFFEKPNQKPWAPSAMASAAARGSLPHVPAR